MKKFLILFCLVVLGLQAQAQSAYHFQRCSLFEVLPVTSKDIVFLGNSITDFCEWPELFDNPRIKNRGISGDRTDWMLERLDPIIEGTPKTLFLLIGTNDLAAGVSPDTVVRNITRIVERFRAESPRTKIYVQSIFPVNPDFPNYAKRHGSKGAEIVEVNRALEKMCAEKGVTYIDLYSVLADEEGKLRKEFTNDGLHLMAPGYLAWKETIESYVK